MGALTETALRAQLFKKRDISVCPYQPSTSFKVNSAMNNIKSSSFPTFQPTHTTRIVNSACKDLFYRVLSLPLRGRKRSRFQPSKFNHVEVYRELPRLGIVSASPQLYSLHQSVGQDVASFTKERMPATQSSVAKLKLSLVTGLPTLVHSQRRFINFNLQPYYSVSTTTVRRALNEPYHQAHKSRMVASSMRISDHLPHGQLMKPFPVDCLLCHSHFRMYQCISTCRGVRINKTFCLFSRSP